MPKAGGTASTSPVETQVRLALGRRIAADDFLGDSSELVARNVEKYSVSFKLRVSA